MVLGQFPVPERPTNLDDGRARAISLVVGAGACYLHVFTLLYLFTPLSPSLWETVRCRLKYCLKGSLNPKQPTNQIHIFPPHSLYLATASRTKMTRWKYVYDISVAMISSVKSIPQQKIFFIVAEGIQKLPERWQSVLTYR